MASPGSAGMSYMYAVTRNPPEAGRSRFIDASQCETCHKRHGLVGVLNLQEEEPKLCYRCHKKEEKAFKVAHVHAPLAGKCTSCHAAHSSDAPKLLKLAAPGSCFKCHD